MSSMGREIEMVKQQLSRLANEQPKPEEKRSFRGEGSWGRQFLFCNLELYGIDYSSVCLFPSRPLF